MSSASACARDGPAGRANSCRRSDTPLDLRSVGEQAQLVESLGYDGLAVEETKDDPYVVMALAAQAPFARFGKAGGTAHPDIPIHVAAVDPRMCSIAGEVADGVRPHPVCTPKFIREVMLPALARGAQAAGRDPARIAVAMKPLSCTAPDAATLARRVRDVRARVALEPAQLSKAVVGSR